MRRMDMRIGLIACVIAGVVLSIVGFPFAVKYESMRIPFMGDYQIHSILFLGSPIHTWSTWGGTVGLIDFFVAFVLNTLACGIIFLIIKSVSNS